MLYELILINEIEQRAKIFFLSVPVVLLAAYSIYNQSMNLSNIVFH